MSLRFICNDFVILVWWCCHRLGGTLVRPTDSRRCKNAHRQIELENIKIHVRWKLQRDPHLPRHQWIRRSASTSVPWWVQCSRVGSTTHLCQFVCSCATVQSCCAYNDTVTCVSLGYIYLYPNTWQQVHAPPVQQTPLETPHPHPSLLHLYFLVPFISMITESVIRHSGQLFMPK